MAVCGLASAGTITETFSLPASGTQATNWTLIGSADSYSYIVANGLDGCTVVLTCGPLTSVTYSLAYASTGIGTATDANSGSTGTDDYTFATDTINTLTADAGLLSASGTAFCSDSTFNNESFGSVMVEPGCAASGSTTPATATGALFTWFNGTDNILSFTGSSQLIASFSGPPYNGGAGSGVSDQTVTITYSYSSAAPEPATLFLMGGALVGVGVLRKRIKSR